MEILSLNILPEVKSIERVNDNEYILTLSSFDGAKISYRKFLNGFNVWLEVIVDGSNFHYAPTSKVELVLFWNAMADKCYDMSSKNIKAKKERARHIVNIVSDGVPF